MKHENQFACDVPPIDPSDPFPETYPGGREQYIADRAWQVLENSRLDRLAIEADRKAGRFTALPVSKLTSTPVRKRWLVKGIIAAGETSAWIAPPGGMKSALMAELAFCVANAEPWHDRKVDGIHCVIYFALERGDLVKRRLRAHIERAKLSEDDVAEMPIFLVAETVDLMAPEAVTKVLRTIEHIRQEYYSADPGLLIFDTFAKLVAAGGGDEDKAKDQGKVFANVQRIKDAIGHGGPHVALVGHTGKDESRGSRGSNAILGDADVMVTISGDAIKTATVTKANDMPEGPLFSFSSATHDFGTDQDGDPITVNVVSSEDISVQIAPKSEKRLNETQEAMYRLLRDAGLTGLSTEDWNVKAREIGIGVKRRATLHNVRSQLCDKGLVREYAGIWRANNG
ncbi:AAA family ATPase [Bradyrhizobium tunisiense]|uniref:AAA family ATPase n=1 Tax=Bradyrhizobium tunisiense TaxID=3278709 RepID=UPI0035E1AD8E